MPPYRNAATGTDTRIARIRVSHHRLPLEPAFHPAWDSRPRGHMDVSLVRVETEAGVVGVGSGDAMPGFAGHEDLFVGRDALDRERHWRVVENLSFHYGRCWPLDVALWDLEGKLRGVPCWKLGGGAGNRLRLYASSGTRRDPGEMGDVATAALEAGFSALKLRFYRARWRSDLHAVEAARRAVGDRLALMVDCNQAWRMPWDTEDPWRLETALEVVRHLEELGVFWMEEPLHRADRDGLRTLRESSSVRIAGGELTREVHELRDLIDGRCYDVLQPDAVLTGGPTGLAPIGRLAAARGVVFTPHTWGNGIGLVANAHLAAGLGGSEYFEYPWDPPEWTPERRDYPLAAPLKHDADGFLTLPDRPGLALELDEDRLAATVPC